MSHMHLSKTGYLRMTYIVSMYAYQRLNLNALLVAELLARHSNGASAKFRTFLESTYKGLVAYGAPSAPMEDLKSAVLRTSVRCHRAICQPDSTFTYSQSINVSKWWPLMLLQMSGEMNEQLMNFATHIIQTSGAG